MGRIDVSGVSQRAGRVGDFPNRTTKGHRKGDFGRVRVAVRTWPGFLISPRLRTRIRRHWLRTRRIRERGQGARRTVEYACARPACTRGGRLRLAFALPLPPSPRHPVNTGRRPRFAHCRKSGPGKAERPATALSTRMRSKRTILPLNGLPAPPAAAGRSASGSRSSRRISGGRRAAGVPARACRESPPGRGRSRC